MRKIFVLAIVCFTILAGCTEKKETFVCDVCTEERSGKQHKIEFLDGELTICKECNDSLSVIYTDLAEKIMSE